MQISKGKIILKAAIMLLIIVSLLCTVSFFVIPSGSYTRIMMHEMYTSPQNIDVVFVGASRYFTGISLEIIDDALGVNSFLLASNSQNPIDSYYILKELYKYHSPEIVVLDTSYRRFFNYSTFMNSNILFDFFRPSQNKLQYLANAFGPSGYISALSPAMHYDIFSKNMLRNITGKFTPEYYSYDYKFATYDTGGYAGKGFAYFKAGLENGNCGIVRDFEPWDEDAADEKHVDYFHKTIELCKANGSEIVLLDLPLHLSNMAHLDNFSENVSYTEDIARAHDVDAYFFTLVKKDVFHRKDEYYADTVHLSLDGAIEFTSVLAEFLKDYQSGSLNPDEYFHSSYEDLMESSSYIFNAWLERDKKSEIITARAYHGTTVTPEFEFLYKENADDEYKLLQDYSPNAAITQELSEAGFLRVNVRPRGTDVEYQQYYESSVKLIESGE